MGISLLKTLIHKNYKCGIDDDFSSPELKEWKEKAKSLRDQFCENFNHCSSKDDGSLSGFSVNNQNIITIHPFWNTQAQKGLLAEAKKSIENPQFIDTFNLLRGPSFVYQNINT